LKSEEIIKLISKRQTEISNQWKTKMEEFQGIKESHSVNVRILETTNDNFIELIFSYLTGNQDSVQLDNLIKRIFDLGWPLSYLMYGMLSFRRVIGTMIINEAENKDVTLNMFNRMDDLLDTLFNQLVLDASTTWENTVTIQRQALMELSAPLIPIVEKISVMPLIGTIDTERAKLIMENLLNGVIAHRAEVVLIDITGVPIVDTMVAHHIIQAHEAVRLVGSECVLVGIRPEIAQTIVNLGIGLGEFPTRSTLQKGIEYALEITKRKIVNTEKGA
jgi:rsbT co-antagonist protein RsbR